MTKTFHLEIVTATQHFFNDDVEMVIVNTVSGSEGFMANHVYATKLLTAGKIKIKMPGDKKLRLAEIKEGYIDVKEDILIFTDRIVWTEI